MSIEEKVAIALYKATRPILPWDHPGVANIRPTYHDRARDLLASLKTEGLEVTDGEHGRVAQG